MRITVVGSSHKFYSGLSAYTTVMANALAGQGHQVSVVLLRNLLPRFLYPGRERVGRAKSTTNFQPGIAVYEGMDWNSPGSWLGALRFLQGCRPEAVIMHWWTSSVAHMQLFLAAGRHRVSGRPFLLLEMHEVVDPLEESILPVRLYARVAARCLVGLCDGYVVHSTETRETVVGVYGMDRAKIGVVPHGPYDNYGTGHSGEDLGLGDGFIILNFGMIRRYKGVPLLVEAFGLLPPHVARRARLVIAGEDWGDDPDVGAALARSPYRDRIVFRAGFVPDDQVGPYFAAADVVALPYRRTCGSGVVNIARAGGKPLITSDLPTMRECLEGFPGADFFPPGDKVALRDRLLDAFVRWERGEARPAPEAATWGPVVSGYETIIADLRR